MSKQNLAFKFRIVPNDVQKILFAKTFGCVRFVYNKMLSERIETYQQYKDEPSVLKSIKEPTPAKYKTEFPFLKEVDSLALANAQLNLRNAYKKFFSGESKFPKFKSKHHEQSYKTNMVNGNIDLKDNQIKLPKVGWVKIKCHRQIPEGHKIKSCTIKKKPSGKYQISILTEFEHLVSSPKLDTTKSVGLDYSSANFYVDSEGKKANYPKFYRKAEEKLAKLQRSLSRKKRGSKNYEKNRIQIAKLHEKIANQRQDFLHNTSKELVQKYDYIFVEDLHMRGMSQSLKLGKSTMDNGWGMFRKFIEYKAKFLGKVFSKINKWFPSSKTCSECGTVKAEKMPLSERVFECEYCSYMDDRDVNAAKNIKTEGLLALQLN